MQAEKKYRIKGQSGAAALIAVLVIGAVLLILAKGMSANGLNSLDTAKYLNGADMARRNAENCAEDALARLKVNPDFLADNILSVQENGQCLMDVFGCCGEKTIRTEGIFGDFHHRINAEATATSGEISILSWDEF